VKIRDAHSIYSRSVLYLASSVLRMDEIGEIISTARYSAIPKSQSRVVEEYPVMSTSQMRSPVILVVTLIARFLFQSVSTRARRMITTLGTPSTIPRQRVNCWMRLANLTAARSRRCRGCRSCKTPSSAYSNSNSSITRAGARTASSDIKACTWSGSSYRHSC